MTKTNNGYLGSKMAAYRVNGLEIVGLRAAARWMRRCLDSGMRVVVEELVAGEWVVRRGM